MVLIVFRKSGAGPAASNTALATGIGWSVLSALLYAGFTLVSGRLSDGLGAGPATTALTVVAAAGDWAVGAGASSGLALGGST